MEIKTTVSEFSKNIKHYHLQPDTYIRVIVNDPDGESANAVESNKLPAITPKEQKRLLNLIPSIYQPKASEELIGIIEESRMNTDSLNLE
ncbi:MAG: hypothetical protein ACUZ8O_03855 [Candidatus Anammoxibacter sp.]